MIKRILVPIDASRHSQSAFRHAALIARKNRASLTCLGVVESKHGYSAALAVGSGAVHQARKASDPLILAAKKRVSDSLVRVARASRCERIPSGTKIVVGDPLRAIVGEAKYHDLIVMGAQTFFGIDPKAGSSELLPKLGGAGSSPILAVPPAFRPPTKVLVALASSPPSFRALHMFVAMRTWNSMPLCLVHVEENWTAGADLLESAVKYLKAHDLRASVIIRHGSPMKIILSMIKDEGFDMLVMGANDREGLAAVRDALLGSTLTKLLSRSGVPIFLYH